METRKQTGSKISTDFSLKKLNLGLLMDGYGTQDSEDFGVYTDPDGDTDMRPLAMPPKSAFTSEAGSAAELSKHTPYNGIPGIRNWNEEFQSLMERSYLDSERDFQRTVKLRQVQRLNEDD